MSLQSPRSIRSILTAGVLVAGGLLVSTPAVATSVTDAPAAPPHCGNADLVASYRHQLGGEGMNQYWGWIVLRNKSEKTCRTGGFGGISYVGHGNGTQIGTPATRWGPAARTYTLRPGQRLRSLVREVNAGVYDKSECGPRHVDGFRVYVPNATRSQFVRHPTTGCANTRVHLLSHKAYQRP